MISNRRRNLDSEETDNNEGEADSLLVRHQHHSDQYKHGTASTTPRSKFKCNICSCRYSCTLVVLLIVSVVLYASVSLIRDIFPETELVLNSKCAAPMTNWDGKIFKIPIWWSSYVGRPSYFNLHRENDYRGNDTNHHIELVNGAGQQRPVVLFGTHHKTGTYLAKKLFSRICSKMNWCCLFHVTRDSIHAVSNSLQTEPVNALGHNQWIWNPKALDIKDYRFVHFYRHPFKKVISGYRYHADGTEEWTKKPLTYDHTCTSSLLSSSAAHSGSDRNTTKFSSIGNTVNRVTSSATADAQVVWEYCEAIHLCETCCRMEHEREVADTVRPRIETFRRSADEYQFICDRLGSGKKAIEAAVARHPETHRQYKNPEHPSIQDMLLAMPARDGILAEAALDYYENVRMARIINETRNDPNTLNIDLDDLNDNFSDVTLRLLKFLEGIIPSSRIKELHKDLAFYDLQTSAIYRWSMSNPIVNHITGTAAPPSKAKSAPLAPLPSDPGSSGGGGLHLKGSSSNSVHDELPTELTASSTYLMSVLKTDKQVTELYAPIMEMMKSVLEK